MKLLLNDKEIAHFLLSLIDHRPAVNSVEYLTTHTQEVVEWIE